MEDIQAVGPSVVVTANTVYVAAYHTTDFFVSRSGADTIPYVTDFAGTLVSPTPRPFYCSIYNDQSLPKVGFFNRHDWYFYTLENVFSLPANQIYVDPDWTWTSSAGQ
jgi:hypothetical protein